MILKNPREELFAQQMASGRMTKKAAAIAAGWPAAVASATASRLVNKSDVSVRISELRVKVSEVATISAARVLEELKRLAFADIRELFDADGNLKALSALTDEQGSMLSSVEIIKKNLVAGDGIFDTVHKIKLWDKTKALEMLAKYFGLLTERVEHSGDISFRWMTPEEKP
jgi:phage terminase small subunit